MQDLSTADLNLINQSNFNFEPILVMLIFFLAFIFLVFLILRIMRKYLTGTRYFKHKVFLVKLPKEKPEDDKKDFSVQQLIEEIAKGETIFASIGGLKAQRGFNHWLFGRDDHFSFEIVALSNKIAFYVITPEKDARYIEQQIHANYPEAVIDEVEDYNIFKPDSQVMAAYLKTKRDFIFPIKTYKEMGTDPMNSLINVLSKLDKDESLVIQYVVRSAFGSWHKRIRKVVENINKSGSISIGIKMTNPGAQFLKSLGLVFDYFAPSKKPDASPKEIKKLTVVEEEMVKHIEEKNAKAGLNVNIRIISCTKSKEKASIYLDNLSNSFSEYSNFSYGNVLVRLNTKKQALDKQISDFIYRRFNESHSFLLNTEELTSLFHFPLKSTETPNILWLTSKIAPAPADVPTEGIMLGTNVYRGVKKEIRIKRQDRRRHTYLVGKSGTGKSVTLNNMAIQDIQNGEGVCVIDPNGDLIQDILDRIPPERAEDVIIFSPADTERPLGLNLLDYDPAYPEQKGFVINEMIGIFDKLYDLKATGGPMFEQYMRNAMMLVMDDIESGSTLMEISKVLADENFRRLKISKCKNQTVVDFWTKEAEKAGGEAALANMVPYITSKLTAFISNDMMRPIIGQQKSSFNMRDVMDKQKILLIDLPKGLIGEMNAYLLGMILVGKILMASLSRTDIKPEDRKDFYLYIDEFQNFTTNSICQILSEARKYALNLIIAHQYIGQLTKNNNTEIKDAIFGNVGTMISFKVGSDDAAFLIKDFAPTFNEYDLVNIEKGMSCIKLLVDNSSTRPFTLKGIWPLLGTKHPQMAERIKALSRLKYGQNSKLVEAEIKRRAV
ncbi:type IV secretion system DNA-binding domain-containing protein [Candidatus Falkowbacteria bacterium]|nr:type IV secretion system DNA-binding domain-containing protein [Candidatus Falkowbacteria bacterium]NCT54531.1 type IV secretion system DNA-binding domain-containing protein [Candidatus Falkowbacteria bacterium]